MGCSHHEANPCSNSSHRNKPKFKLRSAVRLAATIFQRKSTITDGQGGSLHCMARACNRQDWSKGCRMILVVQRRNWMRICKTMTLLQNSERLKQSDTN
eukprot:3838413-Amphidinium_carterae.2